MNSQRWFGVAAGWMALAVPVCAADVPLDLGGNRRGVDMGPSALRIAGLGERVGALGRAVSDKGDLPALTANATGINESVVAPRLLLADVLGRALVIHEGGDNYTDDPENGGGRGRIACGVVPKR